MSDESRPQPARRLPDTGFRSFSAYWLGRADIGLEWKIAAPPARARQRNEFDAMARRREDALIAPLFPIIAPLFPIFTPSFPRKRESRGRGRRLRAPFPA